MRYLKVQWIHEYPDEPEMLYSECDKDGWEMRKVELFQNGRVGRASKLEAAGGSMLGLEPIGSLADINNNPEFNAVNIAKEEFEHAWQYAADLCP